jgi:hypothetical protein
MLSYFLNNCVMIFSTSLTLMRVGNSMQLQFAQDLVGRIPAGATQFSNLFTYALEK